MKYIFMFLIGFLFLASVLIFIICRIMHTKLYEAERMFNRISANFFVKIFASEKISNCRAKFDLCYGILSKLKIARIVFPVLLLAFIIFFCVLK